VSRTSRDSVARTLQTLLSGEEAAVYAYGVAGAHLNGAVLRDVLAGDREHRARRDDVTDRLRATGSRPAPAPVAYRLPGPVRSRNDALLLLTGVEERLAAVWADAAADLHAGLRVWAARELASVAVRAALWRRGSVPFPGLPERAS
jgi:hypothetical protein